MLANLKNKILGAALAGTLWLGSQTGCDPSLDYLTATLESSSALGYPVTQYVYPTYGYGGYAGSSSYDVYGGGYYDGGSGAYGNGCYGGCYDDYYYYDYGW